MAVKTSSNDVPGVVWALGELFFIYFSFSVILTKDLFYIFVLMTKYTAGLAEKMKTGPDDASRIVWALDEYLFIVHLFFFNTN